MTPSTASRPPSPDGGGTGTDCPMPMRLALTALLVRDYDEAIDFYVGKAGFELIEDTDMGGGKRWVVVRPRGSQGGLLLARAVGDQARARSEEHTSELQSRLHLVCRLLLEK